MNNPASKVFFYLYIPATINHLERWLIKKASDGWCLKAKHGWIFVFQKSKPHITRFCYYSGFGTNMGISNDYCTVKKKYSRRNATINKSNSTICEIDVLKIDSDYFHFVSLRNKYYLKHYCGLLLFSIIYAGIALWLNLMYSDLVIFLLFGIVLFIYSMLSVAILSCEGESWLQK